MNIKLFKFLQNLIKIVVSSGLLIMTIHTGLLLIEIYEPISEWLCGFSVGGFLLLLITSFVLKLCNLFRIILFYDFIVDQCILLQRNFKLFDSILIESRLIVFGIGLLLTIYLLYHEFIKKTCWKNAC